MNLQGAVVADPDDGKQFRADGSYLGVNVGNFMISAGFMERWWGPGLGRQPDPLHERAADSERHARTQLHRSVQDASCCPGSGRGARASRSAKTEAHDVPFPNVRFLAARVNFKPRPWLEFGLTRTAQWCGGDRDCGWDTFTDMLFGRDNQVDGGGRRAAARQPDGRLRHAACVRPGRRCRSPFTRSG